LVEGERWVLQRKEVDENNNEDDKEGDRKWENPLGSLKMWRKD